MIVLLYSAALHFHGPTITARIWRHLLDPTVSVEQKEGTRVCGQGRATRPTGVLRIWTTFSVRSRLIYHLGSIAEDEEPEP